MRASGRILVLGGSGQLGRRILAHLESGMVPVVALRHRRPVTSGDATLTVVEGNLDRGLPALGKPVDACISATELFRLPPLVPALAEAGVTRLVGFSSTSIHVKLDSASRYERERVGRVFAAEQELGRSCEAAGIALVVLRPTMIYGGGPNRNLTRAARVILRWGAYPIEPPGSGLRQPVHADDLAALAMRLATADEARAGTFDLGGGERLSYREMIGRVFDALGRRHRFLPIPRLAAVVDLTGRLSGHPEINGEMVRRMNRDLVADDAMARGSLGWEPRPFLAGGRTDLCLDEHQSTSGAGRSDCQT